jgi:DNA-binding winged helix-turn-helix (wHTH) protein/TolB-like protein/Tfp pilus assembly protein PilF
MADPGSYPLSSPPPPQPAARLRPASDAGARPERVSFGPFEADLRSFELFRDGTPVKLQPQPFRVLAALVRRRGELVTREELRREVWGDHTAVDFEHGLNFCVKQARIALGDSAEHPAFIETLPRRGYRFVARVDEHAQRTTTTDPPPSLDAEGAAGVGPVTPGSHGRDLAGPASGSPLARRPAVTRAWRAWALAVAGATLVAVVVIVAASRARARAAGEGGAGGPEVVVVMPFANLTGDPARDALSDGVTDDTIHALTALDPSRVAVLASTTSMAVRGRPRDDVTRELHADYAVEGSLRAQDGHLRVSAALVRARDGHVMWGDTLDAGDVAVAERNLGLAIAQALAVRLDADGARPPPTREAEDGLRKARYLGRKRGADAVPVAIAAYEDAVRIDGASADAQAELAMLYLDAAGVIPVAEAMTKARLAADRALAAAPRNALAYVARGLVSLQADWDWAGADASFARAVALGPGLATAHHMRAAFLSAAGRHAEALAAIRRAQALDPLSSAVVGDAGWHAYLARDYPAAVRDLSRTLELEPGDAWTREHLMNARLLAGDGDGARADALAFAEKLGADGVALASLRALAPQGAVREASRRISASRAAKAAGSPGLAGPFLAATLAAGGADEGALDVLERAEASRAPWLLPALRDPRFDRLRDQPRFVAITRRVRLPEATPLTGSPR